MPDATSRRTILWHSAAQTGLLRRLARAARLDVAGVGCPDTTLSSALAKEWGAETQPLSDLRAAIATAPRGTLVLIADPGSFGAPAAHAADRGGGGGGGTRLDVEELDNAEERGVKIVTLEPIPAALTQFAEAGIKAGKGGVVGADAGGVGTVTPANADWAMLAPLSRFTRPVRELLELLPSIGALRTLSIHSLGTPAHGSLGARLFDAADLAVVIMGPALPEGVHAVFSAPSGGGTRGVHAAPPPPDHIRGLEGDISASLRFDGGRAATITASNRAGSHALSLTLLADQATATIRADRLTVHHHGEGVIPVAPAARPDEDPFVDALAMQLTRYLDSGVGLAGQVDFAATLSLCQAALLSARTGEPESPATMLRLAGL